MVTNRRKAALSTLLTSIASLALVSAQTIVLIPLLVREVGPTLYGAWLGSGDVLYWLQAVDLGLPNLMIQRIGSAHARGDRKEVGEILGSGMLVLGFIALAAFAVAALVVYPLTSSFNLSRTEQQTLVQCFLLGSGASATAIFTNSVLGFSRGIQDTKWLNISGILSIAAGFAVTLWGLHLGWKLWSVAIGLAFRSVVFLLAVLAYLARKQRVEYAKLIVSRRTTVVTLLKVTPATASGGIAYAVMNQSDSAVIGGVLGPSFATDFSITRKALDLARGLVDAVAFASYGGFAHLVATSDYARSRVIHDQIFALRMSVAVALCATYLAVNRALVGVWNGPQFFAGYPVMLAIVANFLATGTAFFLNYMYRATGQVQKGSVLLLVESAARITASIYLTRQLGLLGVPLAGILVSSCSAIIALYWTVKELHWPGRFALTSARLIKWSARAAVLSFGWFVGTLEYEASWQNVIFVGAAVAPAVLTVLIVTDTTLLALAVRTISKVRSGGIFALLGKKGGR